MTGGGTKQTAALKANSFENADNSNGQVKSNKVLKNILCCKSQFASVFTDGIVQLDSNLQQTLKHLIRSNEFKLKLKFKKEMDKNRNILNKYYRPSTSDDVSGSAGAKSEKNPRAFSTNKKRKRNLQLLARKVCLAQNALQLFGMIMFVANRLCAAPIQLTPASRSTIDCFRSQVPRT